MPLVAVEVCESCGRSKGEKHKAGPRPSDKQIESWLVDSVCEATDGCTVEPDGVCPHGHSSWLLVLGLM